MEQLVLYSKLVPPMPSVHYLHRTHLTKKLMKSEHAKVTILHSGAGYGKSSAVAQFFADYPFLYSWYQITEDDDDVLPFLRHLLQSVRRVWPTFGDGLSNWDHLTMFPKAKELNKLCLLFSNEFCKIHQPFFVVLDDFHCIHHVHPINYILDKLIEFLPPNIHFIVTTRVYPDWGCLKNLKLHGQLVECKEGDFIFTEEEIQVLFEDYFHFTLTTDEARAIFAMTEGWAMAILLMAMQNANSTISFERFTQFTLNDFFDYLSDEIFKGIEEYEQQSLLRYSIFSTFSSEIIHDIFGEYEEMQLKALAQKYTFIQPLYGNNAYRFHSLVQQFFEKKWRIVNPNQKVLLHRKIATYFAQKGNLTEAIHHASKTSDEHFMAKLLVAHANDFIKIGQFDWLLEKMKGLSLQCRQQFYLLYYFEGECQRFRAQYEKAKQAYEYCLHLAKEEHDERIVLRANVGLAFIYLDTIQPIEAEAYLTEVLTIAEHVDIEQDELFTLKRLYAENLVNLGHASLAEQWVEEMLLPAHILLRGNLDVRMYLRQGKLLQAKTIIENRLQEDTHLLEAHRETDVLSSLIYAMLGEGELAKEAANKGILNSARKQAYFANAVAYLRNGHAELLLNPFDLDAAVTFYETAIQHMDRMQITRAKAEAYMGLAIAKGRQGLLDDTYMYIQLGLYETERVQDRWVSGLLYIALTIINVENNRLVDAKKAAETGLLLFNTAKDDYCEMVLHFWLARMAMLLRDDESFCKHFNLFANKIIEHSYYFYLTKQTIFSSRDMSVIYEIMQYASTKAQMDVDDLHQLRLRVPLLSDCAFPGHALQIKLLGPFTILRDWSEVSEKVWQRDKAKELFVYLYLHRNRFVSKEELMHALWPSADEETMKRDFKVAYNAMLKALEPDRSARDGSFYISRKQSMYKLIGAPFIISDIDYFLYYANKGLEEKNPVISNEWLMKASAIYSGMLLEDKPQLEWIQIERERFSQIYLEVLERLAQVNTRLKHFEKVISFCQQILKVDHTWEEAYRLMMYSYYQLNNRVLAVKWYERCVEVLFEELKIKPMESTLEMYEMICR